MGLVVILVVLHYLAPGHASLFYSQTGIRAGEYWRLITGHLMHADMQHLIWNCLGLLVLGTLIERFSRLDWWISLLVGIASVNMLLLSPYAQIDHYIGLSGVLNTMLVVALWKEWHQSRSWWVVSIFFTCVAKVVLEVNRGESVLTNISWPPYAWAHVAGLLGGIILVCSSELVGTRIHSGFATVKNVSQKEPIQLEESGSEPSVNVTFQ